MKPILYNGVPVQLGHLDDMLIRCPCKEIGRDIVIGVTFTTHCYTMKFDENVHAKEQIVAYDTGQRPRVFCEERYALSHRLPEKLLELPTRRVYQTAEQRNYVYVVPLELEGRIHQVFLMLQREKRDGKDLRLTVESAYPVPSLASQPKRPGEIRFHVLAHKVMCNKPVRFGAR